MTIEADRETHTTRRLTTLDVAKHILMAARGLSYSEEQAFDELLDVSMRYQVDVVHLTEALVDLADGRDDHLGEHRRARTVALEQWGRLLGEQ